jgi:DNA-binding Lrp family transcriptional regulator
MLFKDGPLTIAQTREQFRRKYPNLSDSSVSSRFSELERRKVIKRVGLSLNPHTGLSGILWDVTSGLPEKPVEITKDQRKASIRARLNIIAQWVPDFVRSEIEAIHVQLKQL